MSTTDNKQVKHTSFLKELLSRRVLQIFCIYIGVSWGIIQFVDWLVNRYLWSPNLTDLAIVTLLSLIPTAMIMAYFHGIPGRNRWTRMEKLFIPLNFIFAIVLLVSIFSGKDLGSVTKTLTLEDESGNKIKKVVPKKEFRKRIAVFNFINKTGDTSLDWLEDGISSLAIMDLSQDLFINAEGSQTSTSLYTTMKKYGFALRSGLPFTLQRKIAREFHLAYFVDGSFRKKNDKLVFETALYETHRGKLIKKREFVGTNIFELTDQLTIQLKKDLEIPRQHIESSDDLPIAEILTRSVEAFKTFILGSIELLFESNHKAAEKYFDESLKIDPTFTMVYFLQGIVTANLNKTEKSKASLEAAMKYLYKLPDNFKYKVKSTYYMMKNEAGKILKLSKMQVELFPDDIQAHQALASFYQQQNQYDLAIVQYQKIIELAANPYVHYHQLGQLYMKKGDNDQALKFYRDYARQFPDQMVSFKKLGEFFEEMGDNKEAKSSYERALLLDSGNISLLLNIGDVESNLGKFSEALGQYEKALQQSQSPREKALIYSKMVKFFQTRGQLKNSLKYLELKFLELEKFLSPFNLMTAKLFNTGDYASAGQLDEARRIVKTFASQLKPPFDRLIVFGSAALHREQKDVPNLEKSLLEIKETMKSFGATIGGARTYYCQLEGETFALKGEYRKAITSFQNHLKLDPTKATINIDIGRCYRQLKEFKQAEKYLQKCLAVHPYGPKTNYELALIYAEMGEREKSLNHLKVALDIWKEADPGFKPAREAREKLIEIQSTSQ